MEWRSSSFANVGLDQKEELESDPGPTKLVLALGLRKQFGVRGMMSLELDVYVRGREFIASAISERMVIKEKYSN